MTSSLYVPLPNRDRFDSQTMENALLPFPELPSFVQSSVLQFEELHRNGRDIVRVHLGPQLYVGLGCILHAAIEQSPMRKQKTNRSKPVENAIIGMAGQVALSLWLRNLGIDASMPLPTTRPDRGYDVYLERGRQKLTFDVKTSLFADGRGSELMRHGDRLPLSLSHRMPNYYCWAVADPEILSQRRQTYVDLVAFIPAYFAIQKHRERPQGVSGVRFGDLLPEHSPQRLLEALIPFVHRGQNIDPAPPDTFTSIEEVLNSDWIARNVLGVEESGTLAVSREIRGAAQGTLTLYLQTF